MSGDDFKKLARRTVEDSEDIIEGLANIEVELVDDVPLGDPDDWRGPNGECPACGLIDCSGEGCSYTRGPNQ